MRRRVSAEEELGVAASRRLEHRGAVRLALEDGQAVEVGPDAADEHVVAVQQNMLRSNGRRHVATLGPAELDSLLGGDVLHDDLQFWDCSDQPCEHFLKKYALAIEDIHSAVSHL